MAKGIQQPAFVLRKRPFQESSEIVDLFTPQHGKVSCVIKGAKRKRLGGSLAQRVQLFRPIVVTFQGRGELKNLLEAEELQAPYFLRDECYYAAHYANELLLRVLQHEESSPELFAQYATLLETLSSGRLPRVPLRRFEWYILQMLGAEPVLTVDVSGRPIDVDKCYYFEAEAGWVEHVDASMAGFPGQWLMNLASDADEAWASKLARELCKKLLLPYIGDAPFKSRLLWQQQMQQQQ